MFKVALIYESGKRYILPIELISEVVKLTDSDIERLKVIVLKEIQKL